MIKVLLTLFLFHVQLQATPNKAFEMMQLNNQVMMIEQTRQIKISESLRLKNEIQDLDVQKLSILNSVKKMKASSKLSQVEKEIEELTQTKNNLLKKITK